MRQDDIVLGKVVKSLVSIREQSNALLKNLAARPNADLYKELAGIMSLNRESTELFKLLTGHTTLLSSITGQTIILDTMIEKINWESLSSSTPGLRGNNRAALGVEMQRAGIVFWGDVALRKEAQLLEIPGCGRKAFHFLLQEILNRGLSLGTILTEESQKRFEVERRRIFAAPG